MRGGVQNQLATATLEAWKPVSLSKKKRLSFAASFEGEQAKLLRKDLSVVNYEEIGPTPHVP